MGDIKNDELAAEMIELDAWMRAQRPASPLLTTYESRARSGLRYLGLDLQNGHGTPVSPPEWRLYRQQQPGPSELHQFGVLCAQHGEGPSDVNQISIDRYWRRAIDVERRPQASTLTSVRRLVAHFNRCSSSAMGGVPLRVPGVQRRPTPPELSATLTADIAAWELCRIEGRAGCARVSARTAEAERRALIAVAREAIKFGPANSLADLVRQATLEPGLLALNNRLRKGDGRTTLAYSAARVCCLVVKSDVLAELGHQPACDDPIARLHELRATYAPKCRELSRTLRGKLRLFIDPARARQLLQVTMKSTPAPSTAPLTSIERRTLTVCLMLQLYCEIPEMPIEIASLPLAAFEPVADTFDVYPSALREPDQTPLARLNPVSAQLLIRYMREVRDQHPHVATPFLFIGRDGRAVSAAWLRVQVQRFIKTHCSIQLSLLELRMVLAFVTLVRDPGARDLAARYLGHERRAAIEPLFQVIEDWRKSGALKRWKEEAM